MIRKLTIATKTLTYSAIAMGGLFLFSPQNDCSNKQEPIKTEKTGKSANPIQGAFGIMCVLCGLGASITNMALKDRKYIESEASRYNIPVDMYRLMTDLYYNNDGVHKPHRKHLAYKLSSCDSDKALSILSSVEKRIDGYKNKYPQLKILGKDEEKRLRQHIAQLKNKEITYIDEYVLKNLTSSKDFPYAFYEGLEGYFKS